MEILFEDKNIIVCVKPVGVISQADENGNKNMVDMLSEITKTDIFPIHRLDKAVGGIMVYAKTKTAAAVLSSQIQNHKFNKEYIAAVHGAPSDKSGNMTDLLYRDRGKNKSYVVKRSRKGVKEASLDYFVSEAKKSEYGTVSIVLVKLYTGRTHQIRVQFASRKMPLVGDRRYGAEDASPQIGLWSFKISFYHPGTNEKIEYIKKPDMGHICYISDML